MTDRVLQALLALCERRRDAMPGHVYFIQGIDGGPIKIGYTAVRATVNPTRWRLAQLQESSPVVLVPRAVWLGDYNLETQLHRLFAADRLHGEWFSPSEDLEDVIAWARDAQALDDWYDGFVAGELRALGEVV